jgi:hypothetical protein
MADALISYFSAAGRVLQYQRASLEVAAGKYAPRISGQLESDFPSIGKLAVPRFSRRILLQQKLSSP